MMTKIMDSMQIDYDLASTIANETNDLTICDINSQNNAISRSIALTSFVAVINYESVKCMQMN